MHSDKFDNLVSTNALFDGNEDYLEHLYDLYCNCPSQLDSSWRDFFSKHLTPIDQREISKEELKGVFKQFRQERRSTQQSLLPSDSHTDEYLSVQRYIQAMYRYGHLHANTNPLTPAIEPINPQDFGCQRVEGLKHKIVWQGEKKSLTLDEIEEKLSQAYTSHIGFEWMDVVDVQERSWLQKEFELMQVTPLSYDEKIRVYRDIYAAEASDKYLGIRYVGQKRFSLQGSESLIPAVNTIIDESSKLDCDEVVIGMAHRGRLAMMLNVCGMSMKDLCDEFDGACYHLDISGDVKYHMGYSRDRMFDDRCVHISLCFNPSHLEFISPVAMGSVRSRLDAQGKGETKFKNSMAILLHGDASFMGQGIASECLNMSYTDAYNIHGSIHVVVNNQIGFTAQPSQSRSTRYATDVARIIYAPILHVNGDDAESVVKAARLAARYRRQFKKDIIIDLISYRRFGHNETDDPSITLPVLYHKIHKHSTVHEINDHQWRTDSKIDSDTLDDIKREVDERIKSGQALVDSLLSEKIMHYRFLWKQFIGIDYFDDENTQFSKSRLMNLANDINYPPDHMKFPRTIRKLLDQRQEMMKKESGINWGMAELLAYASLLIEGFAVRLVGQDSERGTFSHRHALLYDCETDETFNALKQFESRGVHFNIYNSVLSEQATLGFEYGYANTDPFTLVIWEAQFGDFSNGAQVIIDQFISSAWQKWQRLCGIVLLLPHGYEGQGPEHSSARLERYLQLCAQDNMQVCMPTTPAQIFHLIRRQMHRKIRIPLVVMSPKSLLRHHMATSSLDDLATGEFKTLITETDQSIIPEDVNRVILVAGKLYYDLLKVRIDRGITDIALIRLEQLYPLPQEKIKEALSVYSHVSDIVWCQEEPENQGAWQYISQPLQSLLTSSQRLSYIGRPRSASPAVGYVKIHKAETERLLAKALKYNPKEEE